MNVGARAFKPMISVHTAIAPARRAVRFTRSAR